MTVPRRTVLTMLGLAPAGVAVGAESFMTPSNKPGPRVPDTACTTESMAKAFENLAASIRSGEVEIVRMNLHAHMDYEDAIRQTLSVEFFYSDKAEWGS